MTIFGRVVRWLRGWRVWSANRYDPSVNRSSPGDLPIPFGKKTVQEVLRVVVSGFET